MQKKNKAQKSISPVRKNRMSSSLVSPTNESERIIVTSLLLYSFYKNQTIDDIPQSV